MSLTLERKTKETQITLTLDLDTPQEPKIKTGLPFFDHILYSMAFHGGFFLEVQAQGDLEVDPHHLVEDLGLVLGMALHQGLETRGAVARYGHAIIPMDEALSEVVIDVCNRPYWVIQGNLPQAWAGTFDLSLIREFLIALTNKAQINLHCLYRYGTNGHHMVESLFKALGKALHQAYRPREGSKAVMSTKGAL